MAKAYAMTIGSVLFDGEDITKYRFLYNTTVITDKLERHDIGIMVPLTWGQNALQRRNAVEAAIIQAVQANLGVALSGNDIMAVDVITI